MLVGKPGDGQSQNENYALWLSNSNKYIAYFGNGVNYVAVQTPAVTDTNWHYLVATDDGSTAKNYLDGVLKQSTPATVALTPNGLPLNVGRANNNRYFFNGWLDGFALYPSALSAATIQSHYTKGSSDLVPPCLSLTSPANGSFPRSSTVTFAGTAGSAGADSNTVSVNIYSGSSASGTPAQTVSATRQADYSYSVRPPWPTAPGPRRHSRAARRRPASARRTRSALTRSVHRFRRSPPVLRIRAAPQVRASASPTARPGPATFAHSTAPLS